jgi:hypothetical protein
MTYFALIAGKLLYPGTAYHILDVTFSVNEEFDVENPTMCNVGSHLWRRGCREPSSLESQRQTCGFKESAW